MSRRTTASSAAFSPGYAYIAAEPNAAVRPAAAGFVSRSLAMAIDLAAVVTLIVVATLSTELVGLVLPRWMWLNLAIAAAVGVVVSFVPLVYFSALVAVTGRTPGKAIMGIRVVALDGGRLSAPRSVLRALAYLVSLWPAGLGFLWVLVDRNRRAWHDHIAGSRVVYDVRR